MRAPLVLASLILGLIPGAALPCLAWAGDSVCWIENGVLLVPAVAAGVNGVFILDTGAAQSQLDATQASEADISDQAAVGEVRLAGRVYPGVRMQVLELDARTRAFPTPIAGVLGSDILAGQVVEIRPSPCRVRLSRLGRSRGSRSGAQLPIMLKDGVPYVRAGLSDQGRSGIGDFRIDTGGPLAVARASPPAAVRLRALSLGGILLENLDVGPKAEPADDALGRIGEPVWSRFRMRLDYARRTLTLWPK